MQTKKKKKSTRPAMEVRGLSFSYGKNKVIKNASLKIEEGKITTLMGANGCGKSTMFMLMTKNLFPNRGNIFLRGRNLRNVTLKEFAKKVAIVQQYNTASDDITVENLVALGRTPYRKMMQNTKEEDERCIEWAMEVTNIAEFRDREVSRLSGGQRQRVWIAMALAQNTKILFLDEPTTYLDIRYQLEILQLVRKLNREYGITIVMVLHDINQAISFSDRIIGIKNGKVAIEGDPNEVITSDSIEDIYGIRLDVREIDGQKFVMANDVAGTDEPPAQADVMPEPAEEKTGETVEADSKEAVSEETGKAVLPAEDKAEDSSEDSPEPAEGGGTGTNEDTALDSEEVEEETKGIGKKRKLAKTRFGRFLWIALGMICLALGTIGVVLPILPTVPFYMLTLICLAKGSERLHKWFVSTKLYKKNLESFVTHRAMTVKTKATIILTVTIIMGIGFMVMRRLPIVRIILAIVWVCHLIFFVGFVKTEKPSEAELAEDEAEVGMFTAEGSGEE